MRFTGLKDMNSKEKKIKRTHTDKDIDIIFKRMH